MKRNKILLSLLLALLLLPLPQARAAGSIDLQKDAALTLFYHDGSTPLSGAHFSIYYVASADATGELSVTKDFEQFSVDIRGRNDEAWRQLAATLEGYVLRDSLTPADSGVTDAQGMLTFPTSGKRLSAGLYLVLGARHSQDGYDYNASPFMVMLPAIDHESNSWNYAVSAEPKHTKTPSSDVPGTVERRVLKVWDDSGAESERPDGITVQLLRDGAVYDTITLSAANSWRYTWTGLDSQHDWLVVELVPAGYQVSITREGITFVITNSRTPDIPDTPSPPDHPTSPDEPTPSVPDQPTLPQTGQLWWPVPLLLCTGTALVLIGLIRRKGGRSDA